MKSLGDTISFEVGYELARLDLYLWVKKRVTLREFNSGPCYNEQTCNHTAIGIALHILE